MSIRWVVAQDRYYVVSTGYTAEDFVDSGVADPGGRVPQNTDWPTGASFTWFPDKQQQQQHPAFVAASKIVNLFAGRAYIDGLSGLSIPKMHAAKAVEAKDVKFNGITDLSELPFIAAEQAKRPSMTLLQIADEIWAEHIADAEPEADRTEAKRAL